MQPTSTLIPTQQRRLLQELPITVTYVDFILELQQHLKHNTLPQRPIEVLFSEGSAVHPICAGHWLVCAESVKPGALAQHRLTSVVAGIRSVHWGDYELNCFLEGSKLSTRLPGCLRLRYLYRCGNMGWRSATRLLSARQTFVLLLTFSDNSPVWEFTQPTFDGT